MFAFVSIQKIRKTPLQMYLSQKEIDIYGALSLGKKGDWLAGRMAAKKAIHFYFLKKFRAKFNLKDIEIISRRFQKPTYRIIKSESNNEISKEIKYNTNIGISHTNGIAASAIVNIPNDGLIGVDVEKIRDFGPAFLNSFLSEIELSTLKKRPICNRAKFATLLWCVKEAYLKAIGKGLLYHPKFIETRLKMEENIYEIYDNGRKISANIRWRVFQNSYILVKVNVFLKLSTGSDIELYPKLFTNSASSK